MSGEWSSRSDGSVGADTGERQIDFGSSSRARLRYGQVMMCLDRPPETGSLGVEVGEPLGLTRAFRLILGLEGRDLR